MVPTNTKTVEVYRKRYEPSDPRLGRHVNHDSRSLAYQVAAAPLSSLKSIRHQRYIPTLDQLRLGSCTGNAGTGCLGTGVFWPTIQPLNILSDTDALADETYAVNLYSDATKTDPYPGDYPPTDTGSDGLSIAKVLVQRGLIAGYLHATSLEAFLTALAVQPVISGTEWLSGMFTPAADGRLRVTGSVEGGHEYVYDELDVENQRVWMHNSWNDSWGIGGRAYFTWGDVETLLAAEGDVTVFVPNTEPSPSPTPPAPLDPVELFEKRVRRAIREFVNSVR